MAAKILTLKLLQKASVRDQASLNRNLANRVSAQSNLNSVTSVGTRLMSGALGLIGGVPGLVMLGAGAWYAMYQNQSRHVALPRIRQSNRRNTRKNFPHVFV